MPVYRYAGSGDIVFSWDVDRAYRDCRMSSNSRRAYEAEMQKEAKRQEDFERFSRHLGDLLSQQIIKNSRLNRIKDDPFIDPTIDPFKFYKF